MLFEAMVLGVVVVTDESLGVGGEVLLGGTAGAHFLVHSGLLKHLEKKQRLQ